MFLLRHSPIARKTQKQYLEHARREAERTGARKGHILDTLRIGIGSLSHRRKSEDSRQILFFAFNSSDFRRGSVIP